MPKAYGSGAAVLPLGARLTLLVSPARGLRSRSETGPGGRAHALPGRLVRVLWWGASKGARPSRMNAFRARPFEHWKGVWERTRGGEERIVS